MSNAFATFALLIALHAPTGSLFAAESPAPSAPAAATGMIQGRVQNAATGEFLERVRVSAAGRETFSDADGYYRLANLPAGDVRVEAFYTGLATQSFMIAVPPGGAAERDLTLSARAAVAPGAPVQLGEFVVATSREMTGAARAINEQRFAPNLRTVLSADEFGDIAENNVGEFMKFMPGVNIEHSGGNARDVSLNGVPGAYVPITVDGFTLANATGDGAGGTSRAVALDTVSINNLSRVEVTFSPTPESPGAALAGTVNFVPRSAFERTKPVFTFSANLTMREDAREWHATPAPRENTRKVHPGGDFSYVVPVNKRFGFTLAGGFSKVYSGAPSLNAQWRGSQLPTNGAAFPNTTVDRPYLTSYAVANSSKQSDRTSFSATIDYKLTPVDRLSFSVQTSTFGVQTDNNVLTFGITGVTPGNFSLASTRGNPGAGTITLGGSGATRTNLTYMPSLIWRHDGPIWKTEAGIAHSRSNNRSRNGGSGVGDYFGASTVTRTGLTVAFSGISELGPDAITVADAAGNAVNPYSLDSYIATAASRTIRQTDDTQRTAYAKVRRDFYGAVPLSLRAGVDFREGTRDQRFSTPAFTYLGADGVAGNTALAPALNDNRASPFPDPFASRWVGPYRINTFDAFSPTKFYEHYLANPAQFATNANTTYRSEVTNSKRAQELVSAAYLRGDLAFFSNRLKVVGGLRAEQTNIEAEGPFGDPSRNILRDAAGRPILLNGRTQPITTDPLAASRLTFLDRGAKSAKEYLR